MGHFFLSDKEYKLINNINKELVHKLLNVKVKYFSIDSQNSVSNIYGEDVKRIYSYIKEIHCLLEFNNMSKNIITDLAHTLNQTISAYFLKSDLIENNINIKLGDLIFFYDFFYEISNVDTSKIINLDDDFNLYVKIDAFLVANQNTALKFNNIKK